MPVTEAYPTGVQIEGQQQQAQTVAGNQNPVMDALKVIQMYVTAQKQQGNEAPGQAFLALLSSLSGNADVSEQPEDVEQPQKPFNPFDAPPEQPGVGARQEMIPKAGQRPQQSGREMPRVMS